MSRPRNTEHGQQGEFRRGCRCAVCRMSAAFRRGALEEQAGKHRRVKREPQPEKAALWKRAIEQGYAGELADYIVRRRPLPERLASALMRAPIVDEEELE